MVNNAVYLRLFSFIKTEIMEGRISEFQTEITLCRIFGFHSGGNEKFYLLESNAV
jgi:hypothetical protein